jgi:hypothetical protein
MAPLLYSECFMGTQNKPNDERNPGISKERSYNVNGIPSSGAEQGERRTRYSTGKWSFQMICSSEYLGIMHVDWVRSMAQLQPRLQPNNARFEEMDIFEGDGKEAEIRE